MFAKKEQGLRDQIQALEQQLTEAQEQALVAAADAAAQLEGQAAQAGKETEAAAAELAAAHNRAGVAEQRAAQVGTGSALQQQQPAQAPLCKRCDTGWLWCKLLAQGLTAASAGRAGGGAAQIQSCSGADSAHGLQSAT